MAELNEGGQTLPSNPTEGGTPLEPSNQTAAPTQSPEPSNQNGGGNQPDVVAQLRGMQSAFDRLQAQFLQQQQMMLQQQQAQPVQSQANPYDPNTNWPEWIRFENNAAAKQAARETRQEILGAIEQATRQQQEVQWQASHPNIDINLVKGWAQANGVSNLDHAYTLMTLPQTQTQIAAQAAQQTFQQFRNPQQGASPVRAAAPAPNIQPTYDFMKDLTDWQRTDGKIEETWTPQRRADFHQYLKQVKSNQDNGLVTLR